MIPKRVKDETGNTYGNWTVLEFSHTANNKGRNAYWKCKCVCGTITNVMASSLRTGISTQCKSCHGRQQQRTLKYRQGRGKDLYMIRCGPYIKVGVTDNIEVRLRSIQASNPIPVELIGFWKNEGWREEMWHKELEDLHVRGEWFLLKETRVNSKEEK